MSIKWRWVLERFLLVSLGAFLVVLLLPWAMEIDAARIAPTHRDPPAAIDLPDAASLASKRQALVRYIWPTSGFPSSRMPDSVEAVDPTQFPGLPPATDATRVTTAMEHGVDSVGYLFEPANGNGRLAVYHGGHDQGLETGMGSVLALLEAGYAVTALSMPLMGENSRPSVNGTTLTSHDQLATLRTAEFSPISLFVEPVAAAVNYAYSLGYRDVSMTGISGGGWTTTLCAALDPRIRLSYPVAGSLPRHLRSPYDWSQGDYEQQDRELYELASYRELYVMGAHGEGRRQVQVLNVYDPECFAGRGYEQYETDVQATVASLGPGSFRVCGDDSHREHIISFAALLEILRDMDAS